MMNITKLTSSEYSELFSSPNHIFNSVSFTQLNARKCEKIHRLAFSDSKARMGITLGQRENVLYSPFSAPFGGFDYRKDESILKIEEAINALIQYGKDSNKTIKITFPPLFYNESLLSKTIATLINQHAQIEFTEINYHFDLSTFPHFNSLIDRGARKNLNNAMKQGFVFEKIDNENISDIERAYNVIKANRESHGYPLRMSLSDVLETIKIIPAEFFIVKLNNVDVAAAQIFHIKKGIAQVIYWGDTPGYGASRPMNFLSYKLFEYYYNCGLRILDIGPSTESGKPNYGLCDFKENIGCTATLRYTFSLQPI